MPLQKEHPVRFDKARSRFHNNSCMFNPSGQNELTEGVNNYWIVT